MKFVVTVNNRKLLLDAVQVERLVSVIEGCEYYHEEYVGGGRGTMGSNNNYTPRVKPCDIEEWLDIRVMRSDLIDTIKLQMKLEKDPS